MIDSKYLELVLAVDELGTLNKASKHLHLTPSALSHRLKNFEEELGLELFHRVGNQLLFTDAGKEVRDKARVIREEHQNLSKRLQDLKASQMERYVHGYSAKEAQRLLDQAATVADFLHHDSHWPAGTSILEVGCGVGAQTEIIAQQNPSCQFLSVDISSKSLAAAAASIRAKGIENVQFRQVDIRDATSLKGKTFDHIFVCFLLEHLADPLMVLQRLRPLLREGGTITVVEGDHGSTFFYPPSPAAERAVQAQVALQKRNGGNANIGRELFPLLQQAGFTDIRVSPRQIYVDDSRPALKKGFIRNTFTAMVAGVAEEAVAGKIVTSEGMDQGVADLLRTAEPLGTFSYTFFKATATVS